MQQTPDRCNAGRRSTRRLRRCAKVSDRLRPRCYEGMGTIIATLETKESEIRNRCTEFARANRNDCIRGAGLTTTS